MQDDHIFNDADPKQRGHGVDVVRQDGDGLKADWKWTRGRGAGMPYTNKRCIGQTSEVEVGKKILLEAVFWHTHYEARVYWVESEIANYDVDPRYDSEKLALLTRVDAQRKAEELARKFIEIFSQELTAAGL